MVVYANTPDKNNGLTALYQQFNDFFCDIVTGVDQMLPPQVLELKA